MNQHTYSLFLTCNTCYSMASQLPGIQFIAHGVQIVRFPLGNTCRMFPAVSWPCSHPLASTTADPIYHLPFFLASITTSKTMQRLARHSIGARPWLSRSFTRCRLHRAQQQNPVKDNPSIKRIESRLPKFLRRFITPLRDAPVSHITAFIILHEITAVVPLFALVGFFHYSNWLPPYISEGAWVQAGTERFGKWLRKRGWIDAQDDRRSKWYGRGESGVRLVSEFATAYAITKALLPLRLPISVWLTPWFARWTTLPASGVIRRWLKSRGSKKSATAGVPTQGIAKADVSTKSTSKTP